MLSVSAGFYEGLDGIQGGVSNPGVAVSAMSEATLQGIVSFV